MEHPTTAAASGPTSTVVCSSPVPRPHCEVLPMLLNDIARYIPSHPRHYPRVGHYYAMCAASPHFRRAVERQGHGYALRPLQVQRRSMRHPPRSGICEERLLLAHGYTEFGWQGRSAFAENKNCQYANKSLAALRRAGQHLQWWWARHTCACDALPAWSVDDIGTLLAILKASEGHQDDDASSHIATICPIHAQLGWLSETVPQEWSISCMSPTQVWSPATARRAPWRLVADPFPFPTLSSHDTTHSQQTFSLVTGSPTRTSAFPMEPDKSILEMISLFPTSHCIRVLDLTCCDLIRNFEAIASFPQLEALHLSGTEVKDLDFLTSGAHSQLSCLTLARCERLQNASGILSLKPYQLQHLDLTRTPQLPDAERILQHCKGLQELSLAHWPIPRPDLWSLIQRELFTLRHVDLSRTPLSHLECILPLLENSGEVEHPPLRHLRVEGCTELHSLAPLQSVHLQHLETLDLSNTRLTALLERTSLPLDVKWHLRELHLRGCSKFKEFLFLKNCCDTLEVLDLGWTGIEDLSHLSMCHRLQSLKLENCCLFGSAVVIGELRSLVSLDMSGTNITNLSFLCSSLSQLADEGDGIPEELRLERLALQESPQNESWQPHMALPHLAQLRCHACLYLTDLKALRYLPSLQLLTLSRTNIDNLEWILSAPWMQTSLLELNLEHCYQLHDFSTLHHLRSMEVLHLSHTYVTTLHPLEQSSALTEVFVKSCENLPPTDPIFQGPYSQSIMIHT